jgi:hypothetical protein
VAQDSSNVSRYVSHCAVIERDQISRHFAAA